MNKDYMFERGGVMRKRALVAAALLACTPVVAPTPAPTAQALPASPCNTGFKFPTLGWITSAQFEAWYTLCTGRVTGRSGTHVSKVYARPGVQVRAVYQYYSGAWRLVSLQRTWT